jgi:3-hydroxyisobutyrate dehydrogenase-like beta-hydroxyacid dehydrogenase
VADCLRRRGFHTFVWNRTPRPYPNFVGSPSELADLCDFIQLFVADDTAVLQMIQQMKPSLKAHHVVMVHSTIAPDTMREAAEIVQRRGAQLLDAPFTGSKGAAEKAEIVYYVAGDDAAYRRARPVLEASSKEIVEVGEIGQATTIKLATNMITAATVQVAAEALALVEAAGVPLEKFAAAMRSNGSNSGTLTMKLPKMLSSDFETQFSVKHMLKDVQIVSRVARDYGIPLGVTEVARAALIEQVDQGRADADYSAVIRRYFPEPTPAAVDEEPEPESRQGENRDAEVREREEQEREARERDDRVRADRERAERAREDREREDRARAERDREEREERERERAIRETAPEQPAEPEREREPESIRDEREVHSAEAEREETEEVAEAREPVSARLDQPAAEEEREIPDQELDPVGSSNGSGPHDETPDADESETERAAAEEEDAVGNASTAANPETAAPVAATHLKEPTEERRGFLSRIFGRSTDY